MAYSFASVAFGGLGSLNLWRRNPVMAMGERAKRGSHDLSESGR
jgi:hypothetical protein